VVVILATRLAAVVELAGDMAAVATVAVGDMAAAVVGVDTQPITRNPGGISIYSIGEDGNKCRL
jgi:hypothetical protein